MIGLLRKILKPLNYTLIKTGNKDDRFTDFEEIHNTIWKEVSAHTMTSKERIYGVIEAAKYINKYHVEGDVVECGVWRGGSMMAIAKTLNHLQDTGRQLYLYDTFEGMTDPTKEDMDFKNEAAGQLLAKSKKTADSVIWAYSTLETVQKGMASTRYNSKDIHYVSGKVEDTIPGTIPEKIALLRLDTDWYESTKHELIHLFPRLQRGGVLIIDDYGFWKGARKAVDEYFTANNIKIFLSRMDNTGRIAVKQ